MVRIMNFRLILGKEERSKSQTVDRRNEWRAQTAGFYFVGFAKS